MNFTNDEYSAGKIVKGDSQYETLPELTPPDAGLKIKELGEDRKCMPVSLRILLMTLF